MLADSSEPTVLCRTAYGNVSAYWKGDAPVEGGAYDVEFEIDKLLFWDRDIMVSKG